MYASVLLWKASRAFLCQCRGHTIFFPSSSFLSVKSGASRLFPWIFSHLHWVISLTNLNKNIQCTIHLFNLFDCTVHYSHLTCLTYIPKEWGFGDQQVHHLHVISDFSQDLCTRPPPLLPLHPCLCGIGGFEVCPPDRVLYSQSYNKFNINGIINTVCIKSNHVKSLDSVQYLYTLSQYIC